jgi:acetoin utilization protein AcuB
MTADVALVRDWMTPAPVTVTPTTSVATARDLLERRRLRHLPVVDGGRLCGIISDRDVGLSARAVRRASRVGGLEGLLDDDRPVQAIMTRRPYTVPVDAPLLAAVRLLVSRRVHALPVVDGHRLAGIVTTVDCLLAGLQHDLRTDPGAWPDDRAAGDIPRRLT